MGESEVIFELDGNRHHAQFSREHLKLGKLVYVRFDDSGEPISFSLSRSQDSRPFCVTWIAPSEWYVVLQSGYAIEDHMVERILSLAGAPHNRTTVERALHNAAADIRLDYLHKSAEYEKSRLNVILTVVDRLDLYTRLQRPEVSEGLWMHWGPLCTYLLLTCFDRLGQPADWMTFGDWLKASRTAPQRTNALDNVAVDAGHVQAATAPQEAYSERYGFQSSFFRFLHEVLPSEQRHLLLSSIEMDTKPNPPRLGEGTSASEGEKERYLFKLRNDYTHKSHIRVNPWDQSLFGFGDSPEYHRCVWQTQERIFKADHWTQVRTQNWPQILEDTVRVGLRVYLRRLAEDPTGSS